METIKSALVGESSAIRELKDKIGKVAQSDSTVLITGESGVGKELVARAIHENSNRAAQPMIIVNCGAIPSELLEAELFGHVRGAFTGATQNREGRFAAAENGTLFLDEVGEMPLHLQVKLLRVLQTRQYEPVGSSRTVQANVRIIAATNADLEEAVRNRQFREDLYYRLNVIPIKVAPLRERRTDIPVLIAHFFERFNSIIDQKVEELRPEIIQALQSYDWPGNVRELENLIERLVILKGRGTVDLADLPHRIFRKFAETQTTPGAGAVSGADFPRMTLPEKGLDLKEVVAGFENHLIDQALERTGNNKNKASALLQMNRTTLVEKLRRRGMIVPASKRERDEQNLPRQSGATHLDYSSTPETRVNPFRGIDSEQ